MNKTRIDEMNRITEIVYKRLRKKSKEKLQKEIDNCMEGWVDGEIGIGDLLVQHKIPFPIV